MSFLLHTPPFIFTQNKDYGRNSNHQTQALKEFEVKETPDGKQVTFSIKFVTKSGEIIFIPRAVAAELLFNGKDNRMRGILPVDALNEATGHVTPVHIDGIIEWNNKKVRMYGRPCVIAPIPLLFNSFIP